LPNYNIKLNRNLAIWSTVGLAAAETALAVGLSKELGTGLTACLYTLGAMGAVSAAYTAMNNCAVTPARQPTLQSAEAVPPRLDGAVRQPHVTVAINVE